MSARIMKLEEISAFAMYLMKALASQRVLEGHSLTSGFVHPDLSFSQWECTQNHAPLWAAPATIRQHVSPLPGARPCSWLYKTNQVSYFGADASCRHAGVQLSIWKYMYSTCTFIVDLSSRALALHNLLIKHLLQKAGCILVLMRPWVVYPFGKCLTCSKSCTVLLNILLRTCTPELSRWCGFLMAWTPAWRGLMIWMVTA